MTTQEVAVNDEAMAGQEPVTESDGQAPEGGQETKTFDAGYVKQLRDEAAQYRRRVKELEVKVSDFEQAQMTEAEKLRVQAEAAAKQAAAAQEALRQARATAAISREAVRHQVDPDLLARLVDVQFDDDGEPAGVDAAVEQVLNRYPHLRPAAGVNMASTNPQRKPALTLEEVKRMKPDEINARWDEVQLALKTGR